MRTICITLITTSLIAFYSSSSPDLNYMAKISVFIPTLNSTPFMQDIMQEIEGLDGVESQNISLETKTLEMTVNYNSFSVKDFKNSFDKWGWAFEDPIVEDVYY